MNDKDSRLLWEAYLKEGITPEPAGGWRVKPEMEKWLAEKRTEIFTNWTPVMRTFLTGDVVDFTVFKDKPAERKMTLADIVPSKKGEPKTLVDWIRTNIKEVITTAGAWANNDVETNSRLIFDPRRYHHDGVEEPGVEPLSKEEYQEALSRFRHHLVGFGNDPQTMWHIIDMKNAPKVAVALQGGINELFDLTREIIHFNRDQTPDEKSQR